MKSKLRATINKLGNRAAGYGQMNIQSTHKLRWMMGQQYLRWTMYSGWPILVGRILQEEQVKFTYMTFIVSKMNFSSPNLPPFTKLSEKIAHVKSFFK